MKDGVSTATLYERATNEDALVLLDGIDARIVEIFLESFCEYTPDYANLLKSRLGRLEVHSVHTLNTHFEPQLFSPNERAYNDAYGIYHNVLKCAEILNAKNYTMHGRIRMKRGAKFNNYAQTGDYFKKLTALAKEYGVNLCLENVEWAMYSASGYFSEVKDYAPDLCACLDVKQARIAGCDYHGYLKEMGNRLKTVHVSDYDADGRVLLPGKGLFDFERFIGELYKEEFDGPLLIEVYKESYSSLDEVGESLNYIRNLIKRG